MKNYYLIKKKIDNLIKNRYILSEKKKDWENILLEYEDRIAQDHSPRINRRL